MEEGYGNPFQCFHWRIQDRKGEPGELTVHRLQKKSPDTTEATEHTLLAGRVALCTHVTPGISELKANPFKSKGN